MQGLGAAGIMSVNIALVRFIYPSSRLGQGVANIAVIVAVSSAASPSVAAAVLSVASWRWLFLINVPIGVVALAIAARTLPATPRAARSVDPISVALNALAFGLLIVGVDDIGEAGSLGPRRGARRRRGVRLRVRPAPAQAGDAAPAPRPSAPADFLSVARDVDLLLRRAILSFVALPFFEDTLHRSAAATGLMMTPWPLATAVIAPIAGRLADRLVPALLGTPASW